MITTLIFDLDNTLCECGKYYDDARTMFAQRAHQRTGIDAEVCQNILNAIDIESIKLPQGFSRHRFPRSFAAASVALDVLAEHKIVEAAAEEAWLLGDAVFNAPYPLYDGVYSMLTQYKKTGIRLLLWTKGEFEVQRRKIVINELDKLFEATYITLVKDTTLLERIINENTIKRNEVMVIGDSVRDDIGPAMELGVTSVLVQAMQTPAWAYENTNHKSTYVIKVTTDLPQILPLNTEIEK